MKNNNNFFEKALLILVCTVLFCSSLKAQVNESDLHDYGGIKTKIDPSLEYNYAYFPDSLIEKKKLEKFPFQMPILRKEDVMYAETITEEIDIREKKNKHFNFKITDDDENGDQRFIALLIKILESDTANIKAYATNNDRFTIPLSIDSIRGIFKGTLAQTEKVNPATGKSEIKYYYKPSDETPEVDKIFIFRIKAQHIFDNRTSRMYYRILGICPVVRIDGKVNVVNPTTGAAEVRDSSYFKPLFWLYYPKLRKNMAEQIVYNPKNQKAATNWAYVLEHRYFDARIIKTSYDNFSNREIKAYISDPKKRLLESDKIRQRIDDLDEDRWVY
jgi:gliding motility associated protien GldN